MYLPGVARIFPVTSDSSMCPGADSASKSEYQDIPGGKGGRCVRLTTYHLHVQIVKKSGGLNLLEPCGPVQACNGTALPLNITYHISIPYFSYMFRCTSHHLRGVITCSLIKVFTQLLYVEHWMRATRF